MRFLISPEQVNAMPWAFWFRENLAFMNQATVYIVSDYHYYSTQPTRNRIKFYVFVIFGILPACVLGFCIGPWLRKAEARDDAKNNDPISVYHKKGIEYFTVLSMLTRVDCKSD
jgi:hypothetical protein